MKNKEFNPHEWLNDKEPTNKELNFQSIPSEKKEQKNTTRVSSLNNNIISDIEEITSRIELSGIDITSVYSNWRDIGFAFADELGEQGRLYFHKISRLFPNYSIGDCDRQYDNCLKSKGNGITIKTFFHLAQQAGINISTPKEAEEKPDTPIFKTNSLNKKVYDNLPEILKESTDLFKDNIEKDVFLIGAIGVLSGCLPNIEGIYFDEPHSPHLFAFITAPAGSGKGKLKWSKYFGQAIHESFVDASKRSKSEYEIEMENYLNLTKKERQAIDKPEEPKQRMFYIPANSSSAAFIQALADNDFRGVIFETEADTLTNTFKQEWGNFSDVMRKAFHHESTNMFRRKDNEFIEIKNPHLAIVLSGTPRQVHNLMPDVENGLFSRFLYYAFEDNSEFKNPFISYRNINYVDFFNNQGKRIFDLYNQLSRLQQPINFELTKEQGQKFTSIFNEMLKRNNLLLGNDFVANIKRLGLITFRIAMILSALRILEAGDLPNPMVCSDIDFSTALSIATTLEKHAVAVYQNLPNNEFKGKKLKFFEELPEQFDRKTYLEIAEQLDIKHKTAEKYVTQFREKTFLNHEHNQYTKVNKGK